jgi:hypothetical protein
VFQHCSQLPLRRQSIQISEIKSYNSPRAAGLQRAGALENKT